MNSIYIDIELSKTGLKIPKFKSGKLIHSKYDPEKEAINLVNNIDENSFYLVTGIGAGFFIKKLSEKYPNSKIVAIENSQDDIDFLEEHFNIISELKNKNVIITTTENLYDSLLQNYIPSIYPSFKLIEYRSWILENQDIFEKIQNITSEALKNIAQDFSTQAHFGKIWQRNIINNLKQISSDTEIIFPKEKIAVVVAAGPSLDKKIAWIKENRNKIFIFATDTAYKTLQKEQIFSDAVISIDGQNISYQHFLRKINDKTIFIFDLCGNSSCIRKIKKNGNNIIFTTTGHPLITFAEQTQNTDYNFIFANAGTGTVTISALDFANKVGFNEIIVIGADFSFPNKKPYAKGTYLEDIYLSNNNRATTIEKNYISLMYRTEIIKDLKYPTTKILQSYKQAFQKWLEDNNYTFTQKDEMYYCKKESNKNIKLFKQQKFDFEKFCSEINKQNIDKLKIGLLPYISFLRLKDSKKNIKSNFEELLNLAVKDIVRYTIEI